MSTTATANGRPNKARDAAAGANAHSHVSSALYLQKIAVSPPPTIAAVATTAEVTGVGSNSKGFVSQLATDGRGSSTSPNTNSLSASASGSSGSTSVSARNNNVTSSSTAAAASDDAKDVFVNSGLVEWERIRAVWTAQSHGQERAGDLDDFHVQDVMSCLRQYRPFTTPIPLSAMVEILTILWEDEA